VLTYTNVNQLAHLMSQHERMNQQLSRRVGTL